MSLVIESRKKKNLNLGAYKNRSEVVCSSVICGRERWRQSRCPSLGECDINVAEEQRGHCEASGNKYVNTEACINLEKVVLWNEVRNRTISIIQCHLWKLKICAESHRR